MMNNNKLNKFEILEDYQLEKVDGGLIITGTLVAAGFGLFATSFGVGFAIGGTLKKK
ncbi:MAG: ComC/BlpC family leader-containing pheromone/bacteriocin [Streptococcaceae bacterium]|jgi:hypothetical protein|nr:ComC/BlpC family leader-containing pheromone/bacteriocin [Streptococcaceae bacterium]